MLHDVDVAHVGTPGRGDDPGRQHAGGRRLARAVRAEQTEDLARPNAQIEAVHGGHAALVDLGQVDGADDIGRADRRRIEIGERSCQALRRLAGCVRRRLGDPRSGLCDVVGFEQPQFAGGERPEGGRSMPDPVFVGDERHPLPRRAMLEPH